MRLIIQSGAICDSSYGRNSTTIAPLPTVDPQRLTKVRSYSSSLVAMALAARQAETTPFCRVKGQF